MILIILLCWCASAAAAHDGSVTIVGDGALIRYRSMLLAFDGAQSWPAIDLRQATASLPLWQSMTRRKGKARVRITALPGPGGSSALLLDFGDNGYRIVILPTGMAGQEYALLAQHYPGADLALLREKGQYVIVKEERQRDSPFPFSNIKR